MFFLFAPIAAAIEQAEAEKVIKTTAPSETAEVLRLIEEAKHGSEEAFASLIDMYKRLVYNLAYQRTRNHDDAEDVAQEIFIKVWKSLHLFRGESAFSTWIAKIAINASLDYVRKSSRRRTVSLTKQDEDDGDVQAELPDTDVNVNPEEYAQRMEKIAAVRAAIDALGQDQRIVIVMRDIEGMSYEEIAAALDLEMGTVKSRINRARKHIKEFLINGNFLQ